MVKGIERFKEFFKGYEDSYVIIGGTACEIYEELYAQTPRATKDIDMILVVEALTEDFVSKFWEFIKTARYEQRNKGTNQQLGRNHEYYRFLKPADTDCPFQLELFSRHIGLLDFPSSASVTPIPMDADLSSLSAILMDDEYYHFTVEHSHILEGLRIAKIESLICLKCKAFLDLSDRKEKGEAVDSKHIVKHKKDIFRLGAMLVPADQFSDTPSTLSHDVSVFCQQIKDDLPNADFFKSAGLAGLSAENVLAQLQKSFLIE